MTQSGNVPGVENYTYQVLWSVSDGKYIGVCLEFPNLTFAAGTQEKALTGIQGFVAHKLAEMLNENETIPQPNMWVPWVKNLRGSDEP
jgi:predicted RNase H-like HicB family nuclease